MEALASCRGAAGGRGPKLTLGDIFRSAGEAYRATHRLSPEQSKVFKALEVCRTAALGGRVDECQACGHRQVMYNSCRNRHCPGCQSLASARWLAEREEKLLPTHSFHVVFTLPRELHALVRANASTLYGLLLRSAARTLTTLGADPKWLGAQLGATAVLHTWTRDLRFHPHAHLIVTGGGLSPDGNRWVSASPTFLFPVKVMGSVFRGKFLEGLSQLHQRGDLILPGDWQAPGAFYEYTAAVASKSWVVFSKRPFAGASQIYAYLARYTHRVGLSNYRLLDFDGQAVTFKTRGDKVATLPVNTFISRFLQHVLPRGFTRLRHYGLLAPANVGGRLLLARALLGANEPSAESVPHEATGGRDTREPEVLPLDLVCPDSDEAWRTLASALLGLDLRRCPSCGQRALIALPFDAPDRHHTPRGPPARRPP